MGVHFAWNSIFENNAWTKMNLTKLRCGGTFCVKSHFLNIMPEQNVEYKTSLYLLLLQIILFLRQSLQWWWKWHWIRPNKHLQWIFSQRNYRQYLVEPIDMDKSFKPSSELKKYIENARHKETDILEKRKRAIAQLNWL